MKKSILFEAKAIFHLALPLILSLLAYMAMQFIDTVMLGRLGPLALAAAALGSATFTIVFVFCIGTLTAVGTLSAQAFGDNDINKLKLISQQGLWLAFLLTIPTMIVLWNIPRFLIAIKQPVAVVLGTQEFLHGLMWGFLPSLGFIALREYTTAISKPRIVMLIAIGAIPLNALLNIWFIYGGLGVPALRIFGVGFATSIVSWIMFISLLIYLVSHHNVYRFNLWQLGMPKWWDIKKLVKLGAPVGIAFVVEELLFMITVFLVGYFGVISLASHQIAMQCMLAMVMIPFGIGQACAIRVSQLLGSGENTAALRSAYVAIGAGLLIALIVACFVWVYSQVLVGLFINTQNPYHRDVVVLGAKLLMISAIFHVIDAVQIITNGALRGYLDTFFPMLLGIISFWLVGIGSGYWFGFVKGHGAIGLWWGLALGVGSSAILLQWRLWVRSKRSLQTI